MTEVVVIQAEAQVGDQVCGAQLLCNARDWDTHEWIQRYYQDRVSQMIRTEAPAAGLIVFNIYRETLSQTD